MSIPFVADRSGDIAVYQLVKYSVERVCKGRYDKKEIVVDHLILTGKELNDISVGDKVRVTVKKAETISARWNDDGIRVHSDAVKNFYIGEKVVLSKGALCVKE